MDLMPGFQEGRLLRVFLDERDRAGMQPLYTAVVELLRKRGVAGATVFRGIEGFGGHREMHVAKVFSWVPNLPVLIEVVDDQARIEALLPEIEALVPEGLITLEPVAYMRLGPKAAT
jgi:PII-like signaling protein